MKRHGRIALRRNATACGNLPKKLWKKTTAVRPVHWQICFDRIENDAPPLLHLKHHNRPPKPNLISRLQLRTPRRTMYFLAHAIADNPCAAAAVGAALVPAVVKQAVFVGGAVVANVG